MRKAAAWCKQAMTHFIASGSSRALELTCHMQRPFSSSRSVAAAAGSSQPPPGRPQRRYQQPPPVQGSPLQQQQGQPGQQLHRAEYESIKRQWHVKRTQLRHYPEEVQQRILTTSSSRGSAGTARAASSSSGGSAAGGHRGPQAALVASLETLAAALAYERKVGFVNVVGQMERVPVADFAMRRLLDTASQLAAGSAAAHACVQAAQRMPHYPGLPPPERQAAVEAAEAAVQQALLALQVGGRAPQARAARYQAAGQQAQQVQEAHQQRGEQQQRNAAHVGTAAGRQQAAPAASMQHLQPEQQQQPGSAPQLPPAAAAPNVLTTAAVAAAAHSELSDPEFDAAAEQAHAEESGAAVPTAEGEEYVMRGNRRVKAATEAFRRSFAETAAAALAAQQRSGGGSGGSDVAAAEGGEQRSAEWFKLRERRLTASAFSKALGLFSDDRHQLWEEKVGLVQPFAGNAATEWGTSAEPHALNTYQAVTGQRIASCMFQVKHDDPVHGWLGASPDGLIESLTLESSWAPTSSSGTAAAAAGSGPGPWDAAAEAVGSLPPHVAAMVVAGSGPLAGPGRGILEIKCPHNKGQPELAVPPQHATWYYMPQVQGLMDIFDCEWANLYIWTSQRGSAVYHIKRDRAYWARLWSVLADFWWNHVVPARQEFQAGRWEEVEAYRPPMTVPETEELRAWSKRMALAAPVTLFRPQRLRA